MGDTGQLCRATSGTLSTTEERRVKGPQGVLASGSVSHPVRRRAVLHSLACSVSALGNMSAEGQILLSKIQSAFLLFGWGS